VSRFAIAPNLNVIRTPDDRFSATIGYTFNHYRSTGPVSVAL